MASNSKKLIFIIEDEQVLLKALSLKIIEKGYKVLTALDGEMALSMLKNTKPDLILLDILLPKIDGFKVLKKIKAMPGLKNVPVIVLSNLSDTNEIEKGLKLGAKDYYIKSNIKINTVVDHIDSIFKKQNKK